MATSKKNSSKQKSSKKKKTSKTSFKKTNSSKTKKPTSKHQSSQLVELEFLAGLKDSVKDELKKTHIFKDISNVKETENSLSFSYSGNLTKLKRLRTVVAVYAVKHFAVPRPKALLGHEHWTQLLAFLKEIKQLDSFQSFRFSAAGKDSVVFQRLRDDLKKALNLKHDDDGDFLLRFRAANAGLQISGSQVSGWQVLARISRRPLSARAWRQCNLAGGLNATVAATMVALANIKTNEQVYCPMCGSGTLAIETALAHTLEKSVLASDISEEALACARENVAAIANQKTTLTLSCEDVTKTNCDDNSVDVVLVNMPWGDAVGSISDNSELYPAFFQEMQRILTPKGRILLLTHDIKRFEGFIQKTSWHCEQKLQVYHGGHYPKLYLIHDTKH